MPTKKLRVVFGVVLLAACSPALHEPMERSSERATPLHFGLYVTPNPDNNPIDPPERFTGYHVGTDYEVGADELEKDVPVFAVCSGRVVSSGFAEGYGGVVVERCTIKEPVTVIYGHLDPADLPEAQSYLVAGDIIGFLAPARSAASDGNRKHLHLGIHRGSDIDFRGYVQEALELSEYLDAEEVLPAPVGFPPEKIRPYWEEADAAD